VDFGRVNGNLALSRAIGDFEFKKSADLPPEQQIVTAYPDVTIHEMSDDDEFLVIACDGRPQTARCWPSGILIHSPRQVSGIVNHHKPWSSSCDEALLQSNLYKLSART